jgi:DNA-directed RNA polymerase specialized sigma24 family protein
MSDSYDIEIIDRVLDGDVNAFAKIIEKYQNRVFRYVFARCNNYDETVDITQDIFLMTYESLATFRRERSSRPGCTASWLITAKITRKRFSAKKVFYWGDGRRWV